MFTASQNILWNKNGIPHAFVHPCTNFFDTVKEYSIIIAYDENFKKMSEKTQNILIYHELGHVLQKDPSKRKLSDEVAADKFAMDKIGKISKKNVQKCAVNKNNAYLCIRI